MKSKQKKKPVPFIGKKSVISHVVADSLSDEQYEQIAEMLKAIAHPLRIRIVSILCEREVHVNELADILEVKQAIVSQQLRILRMRNLVQASRREGLAVYRLGEPHLKDLIQCVEECIKEKG